MAAVPEPEVVTVMVAVAGEPERVAEVGREQAGRLAALLGIPVRVQERLTVPEKLDLGVRVRVAVPLRPGWAMETAPLVARAKLVLVVPLRVAMAAAEAVSPATLWKQALSVPETTGCAG